MPKKKQKTDKMHKMPNGQMMKDKDMPKMKKQKMVSSRPVQMKSKSTRY
jgi:hypothetical protein